MKFSTALLGASLFLGGQVSLAHPVADSPLTERQSNIVITSGANNGILPRYEIRQLQSTKPNQWILLLLAMQKWQQQSQSPPYTTTYFGISKIHGVPFGNYNNVGNCANCNIGEVWGYCTHANVLFPSWHRAYLALFEQEFIKIAQSLVSTFPASRQADMQNAANKLRLPYYDWAAAPPNNGPVLPAMFTNPTISVDGPSGPQTINNPLYAVPINNPSALFYGGFRNYRTTMRYPTGPGDASATSQEQQAINAMSANRGLRKSQVYQLLTGCKNYLGMSTITGGGGGGCSTSLEGIHDGIHNDVGGQPNGKGENNGGNMRALPVASFDPIFWFHHAMVDRLLAMWQTLNPSLWGAYQTIQPDTLGRTWTIPYNSVQGPDSPLTPFYRDNSGNFWTTNAVRDWSRTFQYTYPEFSNSDGSASAIMSYVNKLYSPSGSAPAGSSKRSLGGDLLSSLLPSTSPSSTTTYWWTANIKSPHFALDGSYNLYTFLSQPQSEDPESWLSDPAYSGTASFLFTPRNPGMQVVRNSTALLTNAVPLNPALEPLVRSGRLASLNPEVISPFLAKNLVWRLQGPTGANVPAGDVRGLQVAVSSTKLKQSEDGGMPDWSDLRVFPSITKDRVGGLRNLAAWGASTVGQVLGNATTVTEILGGLGVLVGDL